MSTRTHTGRYSGSGLAIWSFRRYRAWPRGAAPTAHESELVRSLAALSPGAESSTSEARPEAISGPGSRPPPCSRAGRWGASVEPEGETTGLVTVASFGAEYSRSCYEGAHGLS
jgi:hypothetical protein